MKRILPLLLFCFLSHAVFSQTPISGIIDTHVTLFKSNSPYLVSTNLVISPNGKITIEPGVEVRFANGAGLQVRGDLVALGTAADSIVFTADDPQQLWAGISIANPQGATAQFNFCSFSFAGSAISEQCCGGTAAVIKNSSFRYNQYAINGYAGHFTTIIDSCSFSYNQNAVGGADKDIRASVFDNNQYGLASTERINVSNSSFTNHSQVALLGGRGKLENVVVENNNVGVKAFYEGFTIFKSNISNNTIGVEIGNDAGNFAPIDSSKICNNSLYNVVNNSNANTELYTNCWCSSDSTAIEDKIFDGWDDSSRGLVDYTLIINDCETAVYNTLKAQGRVTYLNMITEVESDRKNAISFYPNPAISSIYVSNPAQVKNIRMLTSSGQQLYEFHELNPDGHIDVGSLQPGLYLIIVTQKTGAQKTEKLLVKR